MDSDEEDAFDRKVLLIPLLRAAEERERKYRGVKMVGAKTGEKKEAAKSKGKKKKGGKLDKDEAGKASESKEEDAHAHIICMYCPAFSERIEIIELSRRTPAAIG